MDDEDPVAGGEGEDAGSLEPGDSGDPSEVRAAEQRFLQAREAWFRERESGGGHD